MAQYIGWVWVAATLLPLAAFVVQILFLRHLGKAGAWFATGAIGLAFVLSTFGLGYYISQRPHSLKKAHHGHGDHASHGAQNDHDDGHKDDGHQSNDAKHADHDKGKDHHHAKAPDKKVVQSADQNGTKNDHETHADDDAHNPVLTQKSFAWLTLAPSKGAASLGNASQVRLGYRIDNITALMFFMVTLIATCIHVYSMGYMSHEPRYGRFFAYLSLFCFSMLALVIADNFFQVFLCWELVGICSYLLIGFYYEKRFASDAANKAFITNRVGDVGFIIGLMILYTNFGTFEFESIFQALATHSVKIDSFWLTVAGLGIFVGCMGKSAQFPLHVWLPDAMAGPTPVSALIHAATMVAAGVYLVARAFPLFTPEALTVITYVGGLTLFVAATIAIVATDIKKALAYSTVSQLGYMMMALGLGGWIAGLMHLITHAFFKALMFLCSGSVIHGSGTQEMPQMGGLHKKMPITSWTMLIGVFAIAGFPFFSGFYSKDAIVAQVLAYWGEYPGHAIVLLLPVLTAGITAFYMFRLWFLTFSGQPRDAHVYEHAHESPAMMWVPLVILSVFAVIAAGMPMIPVVAGLAGVESSDMAHVAGIPVWTWLENFIAFGEPAAARDGFLASVQHQVHDYHDLATVVASVAALLGVVLAVLTYWDRYRALDPNEAQTQLTAVYELLANKWYFDELYRYLLVRPALIIAGWCAWFDKRVIDQFIDQTAAWTVWTSKMDGQFDLGIVDGLVNQVGTTVFSGGRNLRQVQTGWLRGYVAYVAIGAAAVFGVAFYIYSVFPGAK